jgi:hypothetical protein
MFRAFLSCYKCPSEPSGDLKELNRLSMPSVLSPRAEGGSVYVSGHKGAILSISAWLAFAYVARYEGESGVETYFFGIFTFRVDCPDKERIKPSISPVFLV